MKYIILLLIVFLSSCAIQPMPTSVPLRVCKKDEISIDCRRMSIGEMGGTTRGVKMEKEND